MSPLSDQELRDEMKEVVGNPLIRQRQRAVARRMARSRQMRKLPEASVVITNPTHVAVAIRFRRQVDTAPVLLAKGAGHLATDIIARARSYGIPIIEAPPLAPIDLDGDLVRLHEAGGEATGRP